MNRTVAGRMFRLVRRRIARGLALETFGPNEARLAFDLAVASFAAAAAHLFLRAFAPPLANASVFLLPPLFLLFNVLLGVYSRLRTSPGVLKAAILGGSVLLSGALAGVLFGGWASVALWALGAWPPAAIARVLLNMQYSRHRRTPFSSAVRQRGPILVIGGAGYIGSHVVAQLLERGDSVRVLDRCMYGRGSLAEFESHRNLDFMEGDATEISRLTAAMRDVSAVVHLAGLVGDPACAVDPAFTRHANVISTRMAKEVAESLGVFRFVFASSCSVYGVSQKQVCEDDELNPVSLYAQTKVDSERELLASVRDDFFVTILRFATVFGHSRRPRFDLVANLFTAQAMTGGRLTVVGSDQWRPFVHVRDVARAICRVLSAPPPDVQSEIFNVGDSRLNMTILQLAETVRAAVANTRQVELVVHDEIQDRRNYAVSFEKIRSVLDFEAEITMEMGIREMVEKFRQGAYRDFRDDIYSNLAMTKQALAWFNDPIQAASLYAPRVIEANAVRSAPAQPGRQG